MYGGCGSATDPPRSDLLSPPADRRPARWVAATAAVLAGAVLASLALGARSVPPAEVWSALTGGDAAAASVITTLRLPRTLLALVVGVALGLSGTLMQALTRNPLADPGLLGVTMGASTAVVVAIAFGGVSALLGYVWFALAGAGAAAVLVYLVAGRAGAGDRMVLAGAAVSAVLLAVTSAILLRRPEAFRDFRFWDVGSLAGRPTAVVVQIAGLVAAGTLVALLLARPLNALGLGDDSARALGVNLHTTRVLGAAAVTVLCGAATAAAGPIGFVGLVTAHAARLLVGPDLRWALPLAALITPTLLLVADVLGRLVVAPQELSVGVVTAVIGAPVFIALCRRRHLVAL
ncbi:MAG TPA: iron chelate uptake ABC transporter family permease subunit [Pilimelia sp.]|nr:iron chelate uptake ABC transporter family permease subunit [Pilimelia sp.]